MRNEGEIERVEALIFRLRPHKKPNDQAEKGKEEDEKNPEDLGKIGRAGIDDADNGPDGEGQMDEAQ
jgi:hypothetical protein